MLKPLLLLLSLPLAAGAQTSGLSIFYPEKSSVEYSLKGVPSSHRPDPGLLDQRLRGVFVVKKTESYSWAVAQTLGAFHLDKPLPVPGAGYSVPRDLWDVTTDASYHQKLGDRRDWGLAAGFGSASDSPFFSERELLSRFTGTYRIPSRAHNAWIFMLAFSNNRHFANNIPLPAAAYQIHDPEHGLDALLGFPFATVSWKPVPDWSGRFSVYGPDSLSAEVDCLRFKPWQAYAGFDWSQRQWLRARRPDDSQRLFYDSKRWLLGARRPLPWNLRLDVATGYEFGRRFYESDRAKISGVADAGLKAAWTIQAKAGFDW